MIEPKNCLHHRMRKPHQKGLSHYLFPLYVRQYLFKKYFSPKPVDNFKKNRNFSQKISQKLLTEQSKK